MTPGEDEMEKKIRTQSRPFSEIEIFIPGSVQRQAQGGGREGGFGMHRDLGSNLQPGLYQVRGLRLA